MALPAVAIPIALGAAQAIGAGFRAGAAGRQVDAMMSREQRDELRELERRRRSGNLGLTEAQRGMLESEAAGQRAGLLADQQARQLQQAQSNAGFSGREMFLQDVGAAQAQGDLMAQQARQIREADMQMEQQNEQMMRELRQRKLDQESARRAIAPTLAADITGVAAQTAANAVNSFQQQKAQADLMRAMEAGNTAGSRAAAQQLYFLQGMNFARVYGGR